MQENEFEKQVRHKMDGFRLHPSDPVWLAVNEELNRKKKRRLLFIPLFALLLIAGYFGWQQWTTPAKNAVTSSGYKTPVNTNSIEENSSSATTDKTQTAADTETLRQQPVDLSVANEKEPELKKDHVALQPKNSKDDEKQTGNRDRQAISDKQSVEKSTVQTHKLESSPKKDEVAAQINRVNKYHLNSKNEPGDAGTAETNVPEQPKNKVTAQQNTVQLNQMPVYIDKNPVQVNDAQIRKNASLNSIVENKVPGLQLPSLKTEKAFGRDRRLKVGFTFSSGISSRQEAILRLYSGGEEAKSLNSSGPFALNSGNYAGRGVLILQPSAVKAGFAFKAGMLAMKPLSRRFDAAVGLQYSYSSDHIQIGNSINSYIAQGQSQFDIQAAAFNASTKKENYTNKYHFIELPVSLYFNVTPTWKAPFVWNAAVSVSRLISSDVLLYDAALGGVYYQGSKDLNKTQLSLSTGFAFRFSTHNRLQWNIGPEVYMNTSKLFNNIYDKNNHAVYGGLNVQLLFSTKKKNRSIIF